MVKIRILCHLAAVLSMFAASAADQTEARGNCAAANTAPDTNFSAQKCPCANPDLCRTVTKSHGHEVFGFSTRQEGQYEGYDWRQLTTVAWNTDPALMCLAHSKGVRVVLNANVNDASWLGSTIARAEWIEQHLAKAQLYFMDGTNFDLEIPLKPGSQEANDYTALVRETAAAFHAAIPGSQISADIPWSPHGIDGRHFDWQGLADAADLLFIMAYDMQSQIWGSCVASANAPLVLTQHGVEQWLNLGLPASKLVLGLPWYGYIYTCTNEVRGNGTCQLEPTEFRGCPCSDAAGRQEEYQHLFKLSPEEQQLWDVPQHSPYFTHQEEGRSTQVWYDNPRSIAAKAAIAAQKGLRGVGVWHLDCLDYSSGGRIQTQEMWEALREALPIGEDATV